MFIEQPQFNITETSRLNGHLLLEEVQVPMDIVYNGQQQIIPTELVVAVLVE